MSTASVKKTRVTLNNVGVEVKENEMKRTVNNELTCVSIVEQVTKIKDPHARQQKRNVITVQRLVILLECVELQRNSHPFLNRKIHHQKSWLNISATEKQRKINPRKATPQIQILCL